MICSCLVNKGDKPHLLGKAWLVWLLSLSNLELGLVLGLVLGLGLESGIDLGLG